MPDYKTILVESKDRVVTLTVNRPQVRNALGRETVDELHAVLRELSRLAETGVLIVTGAGHRAFVAGADVAELKRRGKREALEGINQELFNAVETFAWPVIAAVNGHALGGGCELALACDLRIASENARFGLPETGLGILPGAGGTQRLPRLVGWGKAKELILTGELVDAREAERIGLVTQVVPPGELLDAAGRLAAKMLARGPLALRLAKLALNMSARTGLDSGLWIERLAQAVLFESKDKLEGLSAFLEKRKPAFTGE